MRYMKTSSKYFENWLFLTTMCNIITEADGLRVYIFLRQQCIIIYAFPHFSLSLAFILLAFELFPKLHKYYKLHIFLGQFSLVFSSLAIWTR